MSNIGVPVREFEAWPLELPAPLRKASPVEEPGNLPSHEPDRRSEPSRVSPERREKEPVPA